MSPIVRMVGRTAAAGQLLAQVAGAGVVALALAVEAGDGSLAGVVRRVPQIWAQAAPALALLGAALVTFRLRRAGVVLGLGTLGRGPAALVLGALLTGAVVGLLAAWVGEVPALSAGWERGIGGWWREGTSFADRGVVEVGPPLLGVRPAWIGIGGSAAAAALGAVLGLATGAPVALFAAALVALAEMMVQGLVERGALATWLAALPAVLEAFAGAVAWRSARVH